MKDRHDSINNNHSDEEEESRKSNLTNKADKPLGTDTFEMRWFFKLKFMEKNK